MKRLLWLLLLLILIIPSVAQESYEDFSWTFADIAFRYPSSWDMPVQRFETGTGRINMLLAQTLVDSPETRPPAIPFITISLLRPIADVDGIVPEIDLYAQLAADLQTIDINPIGALPGVFLDKQSVLTRGTSDDGSLFGIGQAVELDNNLGILLVYGRASSGQRDSFVSTFNIISNSLTFGASSGGLEINYGVLWHQRRTLLDGDSAFLDLGGIVYAPDDFLYAVDSGVGLLQLDPSNGRIVTTTSFDEEFLPTDIVVGQDNTVYIADLACNCIHVISESEEIDTIEGFGANAPLSIAVTPDNVIYATDEDDNGILLRVFGADDDNIPFDIPANNQPLLAIDLLGELVGIVDSIGVYKIIEGVFSEQFQLTSTVLPTAVAIDSRNNLIIATQDDGIVLFDSLGNEVNRIGTPVDVDPQAGELISPSGVASASDGSIYWADSNGTYGNITGVSLSVEVGRVGASNMTQGSVVEGILSNVIRRQTWTFDANANDIITLTAIADLFEPDLDLALRLLDPTGRELFAVDTAPEDIFLFNPFDPQIDNVTLPRDGQYFIIVESVSGDGRYELGLSKSQLLDISSGNATVTGTIDEALPVERWVFEGRAGQSIQITMTTDSTTLDPQLILLRSNGIEIDFNDDAFDPELGLNAQITDISLPVTGQYIIEARRFDGEGAYELKVELE